MGACATPLKIPQVNFSKLHFSNPGDDLWTASRSKVMQSLETYGCVEILYDKITAETREQFFGKVVKEAFELPRETKLRNNNGLAYSGYIDKLPEDVIYEGLRIDKCTDRNEIDKFTTLMWENTDRSGPIFTFVSGLKELDDMARRMVFEAYGVEKYLESHLESHEQSIRLARYGAPMTEEPIVGLKTHTDPTLISIICQHEREGLEILTKDGSWITPSRDSLILIVGDLLAAWSNGRLKHVKHQVVTVGDTDRYSTTYSTTPKDGFVIQAPKELIDDEHPMMFKPFHGKDYYQFRFSEAGQKEDDPLMAFCGSTGGEVAA